MNEKRNTMRRLEDKELLPTSWLCRFGWHDWERWKHATNDSKRYWKQYRTCVHCGRNEVRKVIGDSYIDS